MVTLGQYLIVSGLLFTIGFAGVLLRPNSSFAGVAGSSGWASAGSGSGLTLPRSCAAASCGAHNRTAHSNGAARRAAERQAAPNGVEIVVVMLAASELGMGRPRRGIGRPESAPNPAVHCR